MPRIAIVEIATEFLQHIITEGWEGSARCVKGLPPEAVLCDTYYDEAGSLIGLGFEHSQFQDVPSDQPAPTIAIVHETVDGLEDHTVDDALLALVGAIDNIDGGCPTCIGAFIEEANGLLKGAGIAWRYRREEDADGVALAYEGGSPAEE